MGFNSVFKGLMSIQKFFRGGGEDKLALDVKLNTTRELSARATSVAGAKREERTQIILGRS
jgi:hypothetical protein